MFLVQLKLRRRRGIVQTVLGIGMLALMIPAWLLFRNLAGSAVVTVIAGSVIGIAGITVAARGMLQVGLATRHLHATNALRQLPVARARLLPP